MYLTHPELEWGLRIPDTKERQ